jgi:hypothetical protein
MAKKRKRSTKKLGLKILAGLAAISMIMSVVAMFLV